jgi:hypothetical protein
MVSPATPQYLVRYNNHVLPGFCQAESFDSEMNLAAHYGAYIDGSPTEETGLSNKNLQLTMKVWDCDSYLAAKNQVELAATMLRSYRAGFAPLYVQYTDRHYDAQVKSIQVQKQAGTSTKILDYNAGFECKPWLIEDATQTINGTGTIDTDQVSRTIDNGGWTPAVITLTGTDITVSGYTDTGHFAGFLSITGAVAGLIVDTEAFTATEGSANANEKMLSTDYRLYVGPGKTSFDVSGASSASISYQNRWYI